MKWFSLKLWITLAVVGVLSMKITIKQRNNCSDCKYPGSIVEGPVETFETQPVNAPDLLAKGFVELYRPSLSKIENDLKELTDKQEKIHDDLGAEIEKISDDKLQDIHQMIMKMKNYKEKLVAIKRQMVHIHHRTRNLKRRSITLQAFKQAEIEAKIQKRNREENLIAGASKTESISTDTPSNLP